MFFECVFLCVFFFKQKTAYEMRISDWSSDVCSSDLEGVGRDAADRRGAIGEGVGRKDAREIGVASVGARARSEERRVGKSVSVRVDLGGRRIIKKKKNSTSRTNFNDTSRSNMVCKR